MNTEKTGKELRQLFGELRTREQRHAPSFATLATESAPGPAASSSRMSLPWFRLALGTTAMALLLAGIALAANRTRARARQREMQQWAALSTWEAPTDALLSISSVPWGSSVTAPSDSLLNTSPDSSGTTIEKL